MTAYRLPALLFVAACLPAASAHVAAAQSAPDGFIVEPVHSAPAPKAVGFAFLPDERILVIDKESAGVHLLIDGTAKSDPVGTIPGVLPERERGLLGIAVDPDWPAEPFLYLYYSSETGYNRVSKFRVDGDVDDPTSDDLTVNLPSEQILLAMKDDQPIHNAGTLRFGSDKTLYVSHGDDLKFVDDAEPYMQDLTNPYGKILRINRDGSIPEDNPSFPEATDGRLPEIFAIGLRNPFRFAIDRFTDRLFIGDVGTEIREEFDLSSGGENFGYPRHEGTTFFRENYRLTAPEPTVPIHDYSNPDPGQASAIALATYRPVNYPDDLSFPPAYDGVNFFADFFTSGLKYVRETVDGWEVETFGAGYSRLVDGAVGPDGSLYVLSFAGPLLRISYRPNVSAEDQITSHPLLLHQNHPNPFADRTVIPFDLDEAGPVRIEVFDVLGRRIETLLDAWRSAGSHAVRFDGSSVAPGPYLYRIEVEGAVRSGTMVRLDQ